MGLPGQPGVDACPPRPRKPGKCGFSGADFPLALPGTAPGVRASCRPGRAPMELWDDTGPREAAPHVHLRLSRFRRPWQGSRAAGQASSTTPAATSKQRASCTHTRAACGVSVPYSSVPALSLSAPLRTENDLCRNSKPGQPARGRHVSPVCPSRPQGFVPSSLT